MLGDDERTAIAAHAAAAGVAVPSVRRRGGAVDALVWGERPRWLLLHGGSLNAHTWNATILAGGLSALAVDLPGHGRSAHGGPYTLDTMADAIAEAVRAEALAPLRVVGHSLGGMIGIRLAARHPDVVAGLVVVDADPDGFGKIPPKQDVRHSGTFDELVDDVAGFVTHGDRARIEAGVRMNVVAVDGRWQWRWDPDVRAGIPAMMTQWEQLWAELEALTVPVGQVRGERSRLVRDAALERLRRIPGFAEGVAPGAGHNVQSDAPQWLAEWLVSWALTTTRSQTAEQE